MQQPPYPGPRNMPAAPLPPARPPRSYGSLRLLAGGCIVSAWLSLVLSVLFGLAMLAAPSPSAMPGMPPSYPGGPGFPGGPGNDLGLSPSPGAGQLGPLLGLMLPGLKLFGAVTTIGGGILSWLLLLAIGQALYLLLDMEENTRITVNALLQLARRQGL